MLELPIDQLLAIDHAPPGSTPSLVADLCRQLDGLPRHLGQHNGGMVLTGAPLSERVPTEPAAMPGRMVIQWDKDALEEVGLVKIDLLGLRMLSAIAEAERLIEHLILAGAYDGWGGQRRQVLWELGTLRYEVDELDLPIPSSAVDLPPLAPDSVLHVNGQRYIVTGFETQWVKNARKVNRGMLARGRKREQVVLVGLPVEERPPILREFPRQIPHGVPFFEKLLNIPGDPEALAAAAPRCPVFRLDSLPLNEHP